MHACGTLHYTRGSRICSYPDAGMPIVRPLLPAKAVHRPLRRASTALALVAALLLLTEAASGATWVVDRDDDSVDAIPGDGLCADATGRCSLRAAVQESNALAGADRIELPPGVYRLQRAGFGEDAAGTGDLDIRDAVTLVGAGSATTFVDGGALDGILDIVAGGTVSVSGLTLRNGLGQVAPPSDVMRGVGLSVAEGVSVNLSDVVIREQQVQPGLSGPALGIGAAGCVRGERVRVVDNGDFASNRCPRAGGILVSGMQSCLDLVDFEVSRNCGRTTAAIAFERNVEAHLRRGLVTGNVGTGQTILANLANDVAIDNVTIAHNRSGAALLNDGFSTVRLRNATVTGNRRPDGQGLVVVGGIQDVHGVPRTHLTNTIVFGNGPGSLADDCSAVFLHGGNLIGDHLHCRTDGVSATDLFDVDPVFEPLRDLGGFAMSVQPGPPAIDAGIDTDCPADDQRGQSRPRDGDGDGEARCDRGAVEVVADPVFGHGFEDPAN